MAVIYWELMTSCNTFYLHKDLVKYSVCGYSLYLICSCLGSGNCKKVKSEAFVQQVFLTTKARS